MGIKMQGVIGEGGYCVAKECEVNGKAMVAKEYLPNSVDIINELGLTLVKHAKKSVQMHVTAAHMAKKFGQVMRSAGVVNYFRYIDCFLGMVIDGPQLEQVITVEPKLDGVFTKYINNDGEIFNVNVGSCSLHIVNGTFKKGFDSGTTWEIEKILNAMYKFFYDDPA